MTDGVDTELGVVNGLLRATEIARAAEVRRAANGIAFAVVGETGLKDADLLRILEAVPQEISQALEDKVYYFVPLALAEARGHRGATEETMVAPVYTPELADEAVCHRNVALGEGREGVFISARLLNDQFAVAFEFFINVSHAFTDRTPPRQELQDLFWAQAVAGARGETSQDAQESRELALKDRNRPDLKARQEYLQYAYSDALAIYQLSLALDFDYSELREREYPLLAPAALAERLKLVATLFPANKGYEFAIRYRRR